MILGTGRVWRVRDYLLDNGAPEDNGCGLWV
jgi:hypothetical protein